MPLHVLFWCTDNGNIEDEGFLLSTTAEDNIPRGDHAATPGGSSSANPSPPVKPQTSSEVTLDEGSGSAFSGDGQGADLWSWQLAAPSDDTVPHSYFPACLSDYKNAEPEWAGNHRNHRVTGSLNP